ncbi:MAG: MATE family efflux transporter [Candidatus Symbiothrix sp.]|jgi:O-antigen/teichoic acid export membrane protein|nr:MATE family efflux transporter [Candidatus Symbiothrix sp.]
MHRNFSTIVKQFLSSGTERTHVLKKNIAGSFFLKLIGIIISLLLVPLTIHYVDTESYGIWLTVSSITGWFAFFDIGLSNGLRNKFTEAVTKKDTQLAKTYVSSTYAMLSAIFFVVWIIFILINNYIDWSSLLNVDQSLSSTLSSLFLIVFTYFCIQFILRIIITILTADQKPAKASLIDVAGQLVSLLIIFILTKTTQGSLIYLGISLCLAPLIVLLISNLILFSTKYKSYRPSFSHINIDSCKSIFHLGIVFFVIQVAGLIHYQSANFIIGRYMGMEDVTLYNITYKYFNVLYMGFLTLLIPFWSAATNAYVSNDHEWIKRAVKKYHLVLFVFIIIGVLMFCFSSVAYSIWIGKDVISIPYMVSFWCLLSTISMMFGSIFVNLMNGIGALKIQFYSCFVSPFLFIALCLGLLKYFNMGVCSIFIASIISNVNGIVLAPLQYRKIFIEGKGGIWKA